MLDCKASASSLGLRWTAATGLGASPSEEFELVVGNDKGQSPGDKKSVYSGKDTSYSIDGLDHSTTRYVQVRAKNKGGWYLSTHIRTHTNRYTHERQTTGASGAQSRRSAQIRSRSRKRSQAPGLLRPTLFRLQELTESYVCFVTHSLIHSQMQVACGAKAADGQNKTGGRGAIITADFKLNKNDLLEILCGGMSTRSGSGDTGGGQRLCVSTCVSESLSFTQREVPSCR